jgi:hypothetical protein
MRLDHLVLHIGTKLIAPPPKSKPREARHCQTVCCLRVYGKAAGHMSLLSCSKTTFRQGSTENQARNRPGSLPAKSLDDTPSPPPLIHNGTERELPSMDSRLEHVLQFLQSVKFDSIDSLVSSYYTAELRERSTLRRSSRICRSILAPGPCASLMRTEI